MILSLAREMFPHLGFAVYAYDPQGPVTLEVHWPDGSVYTTTAPTDEACFAAALGVTLPPVSADPDVSAVSEEPIDIYG